MPVKETFFTVWIAGTQIEEITTPVPEIRDINPCVTEMWRWSENSTHNFNYEFASLDESLR